MNNVTMKYETPQWLTSLETSKIEKRLEIKKKEEIPKGETSSSRTEFLRAEWINRLKRIFL